MDDFVIKWAGRLRWACLGCAVYDLAVGWYIWFWLMIVGAAALWGIHADLKRIRDRDLS